MVVFDWKPMLMVILTFVFLFWMGIDGYKTFSEIRFDTRLEQVAEVAKAEKNDKADMVISKILSSEFVNEDIDRAVKQAQSELRKAGINSGADDFNYIVRLWEQVS